MLRISWLAEKMLASQEGLCSMELHLKNPIVGILDGYLMRLSRVKII